MKIIGDVYTIADDNEALAALNEMGIANEFIAQRSFTEPTNMFVTHDKHPTHYVVAVKFEGHKKKEDNGYKIDFFAKKRFTRNQIDTIIKEMMKQGCCNVLSFSEKPFPNPND